jgi:hypothetical protein
MPSEIQSALAEGVAALADVQGNPLWTYGAGSFSAPASLLKPDDPRLKGASDRVFEIIVPTALLPEPAPKQGVELSRSGKFHRVVRVDQDATTGLTSILVVLE